MYKYLIIIFTLCSTGLSAQKAYEGKNLIVYFSYAPSLQISQQDTIQRIFNGIKRSVPGDFFENIYWLNEIEKATQSRDLFIDVLNSTDELGNQEIVISKEFSALLNQQQKQIIGSDYFLFIEIEGNSNRRQSFTFSLYPVTSGKIAKDGTHKTIELPTIRFGAEKETASCIYDFSASADKELTNTIKRLFKGIVNTPSIISIEVDSMPYIPKTEVVRGLGDTIHLSIWKSNDIDNLRSDFSYHWRQISTDGAVNPPGEMQLSFSENTPEQYISPTVTGMYWIGVKIYDGIEYSKEDTVTIEIINIPKLVFVPPFPKQYERISYPQYLFRPRKFMHQKVDFSVTFGLANYPDEDWELESMGVRFREDGYPKRLAESPVKLKRLFNPDNTQTLEFNGKLNRRILAEYYFRGSHRGVKSNSEWVKVKNPYIVGFEDVSMGFGTFLNWNALGELNQDAIAFPFELAIYTPLFYSPASYNYVAFGLSLLIFTDSPAQDLSEKSVFELSLRVSAGQRNKSGKKKFIKEGSFYGELNYLTKPVPTLTNESDAKIGLNLFGMSVDSKYIGFEVELLNFYFDIHKLHNVFWSPSVKIDLGPMIETGQYPDSMLY